MITEKLKYIIFPFVSLIITWTLSCSGRTGSKDNVEVLPAEKPVENLSGNYVTMVQPEENTGFKLREPVKVVLGITNEKKLPDSVLISFDGKPVKTLTSGPWEYSIPSAFTVTTGRKSLKISAYREGKAQIPVTRFMIIYSDVVPKRNGFKVLHSYPHDVK